MENSETNYDITSKNSDKYADLLYSRGFLISDKPYTVKESWKHWNFYADLYITHDPRIECVCAQNDDNFVLILGTAMDTEDWHMDLKNISEKCLKRYSASPGLFYDYIDILCGRHLICFGNKNERYIVTDAVGMRACCYSTTRCLAASHYGIIADVTHDEPFWFMEKFQKKGSHPWLLPGAHTPYNNIMCLVPNHELNLKDMSIRRFWPRKPHEHLSVETGYDYIADNLRNQLITLSRYHKMMFQLTRGNDSRIGLAVSRPLKDEAVYYTYYCDEDKNQKIDAEFAHNYAKQLGLNHILLHNFVPDNMKSDLAKLSAVLQKNHYHRHVYEAYFSYNEYLPKNRLNIRSNLIEIVRHSVTRGLYFYKKYDNVADIISDFCTYSDYDKNDEEDFHMFEEFYYDNSYDKIFNYNELWLLHWEYRLGLWLCDAVLKKDDVNFDTYMMFNCRKILEIGACVPKNFKDDNYLVYKVINKLWPEVFEPFPNTDYKLTDYYSFNDKGLTEFKNRCTIRSNLPSEEIFVKLNRFGASIGFANSNAKKSDYIELAVNVFCSPGKCYHIQTGITVQWSECVSNSQDCEYEIYLDDDPVYSVSCNRFMNKENQINIIAGFSSEGTHSLKYVLRMVKDSENVNYSSGLIHIGRLLIAGRDNREAPSKPIVRTTIDMLNGI